MTALHARLLIVVVTAAAYSSSFWGVFIFDDENAIVQNPSIASFWSSLDPPADLVAVHGRPVANVSLWLNYSISGYSPWSYHLLNLTAHIATALLLFEIVRRTLNAQGAALAVALLWAVHPLTTDAVTYVIQRNEVFAGLFFLASFYCVMRGRYYLAVAACALAMGSKESVVLGPLVILLYDRIFMALSWKEIFRYRKWLYAGLAATWIIVLLPFIYGSMRSEMFHSPLHRIEYPLAQCQIVPHYLRLVFWPAPLVVDYGSMLPASNFAVVYVLGMTAMLAGTVLLLYYKPKLGFLAVWFFAFLAPSSSIVPLALQVAAEKRMYLPLAAVIMGVVLLLRRVPHVRWAAVAAVCACCVLTFARNLDYRNAIGIWSDTVAKMPDNSRAWNNLAVSLGRAGRFKEAGGACIRALKIDPHNADAYYNLGMAWANLGNPQKAEYCRQRAIRLRGVE